MREGVAWAAGSAFVTLCLLAWLVDALGPMIQAICVGVGCYATWVIYRDNHRWVRNRLKRGWRWNQVDRYIK